MDKIILAAFLCLIVILAILSLLEKGGVHIL